MGTSQAAAARIVRQLVQVYATTNAAVTTTTDKASMQITGRPAASTRQAAVASGLTTVPGVTSVGTGGASYSGGLLNYSGVGSAAVGAGIVGTGAVMAGGLFRPGGLLGTAITSGSTAVGDSVPFRSNVPVSTNGVGTGAGAGAGMPGRPVIYNSSGVPIDPVTGRPLTNAQTANNSDGKTPATATTTGASSAIDPLTGRPLVSNASAGAMSPGGAMQNAVTGLNPTGSAVGGIPPVDAAAVAAKGLGGGGGGGLGALGGLGAAAVAKPVAFGALGTGVSGASVPNIPMAAMGGAGSTSPMMPMMPMMPMGGAHGAGGEQGGNRRVPSWLVETEDVWGESSMLAPPVIGDANPHRG